jgi:hypothetical protein
LPPGDAVSSQLKVPVVVRDDFTIFLERFADRTWGHVDFRRWSASALRQFRADVALLVALQGEPLLVTHYPGDVRHAKFLRLAGASLFFTSTDRNGAPLEVHEFT